MEFLMSHLYFPKEYLMCICQRIQVRSEIFHGVHIPQENFTYYFIPHHRKYIDGTYAQCTMERVNVIPLNIHAQQLSCVLITPLTFSNYI